MNNILEFQPEFVNDEFIVNKKGEFVTIFETTADLEALSLEEFNSVFKGYFRTLPQKTKVDKYSSEINSELFYLTFTFIDVKQDDLEMYCNQIMSIFESFRGLAAEHCTGKKLVEIYYKIMDSDTLHDLNKNFYNQ